jgi:mevalonate kinase
MMSPRRVSSALGKGHGKIILLGEHAVVYGFPALAAALQKGIYAEAVPSDSPFSVHIDNWKMRISPSDDTPHGRALSAMINRFELRPDRLMVSIFPEIPARAGLGASAAMAAAIARCLAAFYVRSFHDSELFDAVQCSETVFHGNPSGLDASMAIKGGFGLFTRADGYCPIAAKMPRILVVHSGAPKDTARSVAKFKARMEEAPAEASGRLQCIADLVHAGEEALKVGDEKTLGALMTENHRHLQWFNVSTAALDDIVDISLRVGALGAKLTGGGCGGCATVLVSANDEDTEAAILAAGYEVVIS